MPGLLVSLLIHLPLQQQSLDSRFALVVVEVSGTVRVRLGAQEEGYTGGRATVYLSTPYPPILAGQDKKRKS